MNKQIEEQLLKEGYYVSTTVGRSMRPMLRNRRDRVVLRAVSREERLARMDLPLYRYPDGRYVLHRIIGTEGDVYLIRGDNTYAVERIPHEWILGVVTEFYRGERHWSVESRRYRRYARFWNAIYPLRAFLHRVRGFLGRIFRQVFPKKE